MKRFYVFFIIINEEYLIKHACLFFQVSLTKITFGLSTHVVDFKKIIVQAQASK